MSIKFSDRVKMMVPPLWWDGPQRLENDGARVVLLHGLGRSRRSMEPLARRIQAEGFEILNIPYASLRKPLDRIVTEIGGQIREFAGDRPVHLVGHSLGGIIMRVLISQNPSWKIGRLIMLAPPNGGSEIIDWLSRKFLIRSLLSPAARALKTTGVPSQLPQLPPELEAMVIMGKRSSIPFFRNLLAAENDGIVSVEQGRLPGLKAFAVVDADHTFISITEETVELTIEFLKSGRSAD